MPKRTSSATFSPLERAAGIVLPKFELVDTPVVAAIVALRMGAEQLAFPGIALEITPEGRAAARHLRISLSLVNATVEEACRRIAELASLELIPSASGRALVFTNAVRAPETPEGKLSQGPLHAIQPGNIPVFERLISRVKSSRKTTTFSAADWKKLNETLRYPCPEWYQELTKAYPLGGAGFRVSVEGEYENHDDATFAILAPKHLLAYCTQDYFFADDFFPQWFQFAEAVEFGGPTRWLIPNDPSAEPIVHTFSDGDSDPFSLDCRFDELLLRATFDPSLCVGK